MEPRIGQDIDMTSNKKFIASVVIAFAALAGSAATAQADRPCGSGTGTVYCGSQNVPNMQTPAQQKRTTKIATDAAKTIRSSLGLPN
jgi:hypothetical protein